MGRGYDQSSSRRLTLQIVYDILFFFYWNFYWTAVLSCVETVTIQHPIAYWLDSLATDVISNREFRG